MTVASKTELYLCRGNVSSTEKVAKTFVFNLISIQNEMEESCALVLKGQTNKKDRQCRSISCRTSVLYIISFESHDVIGVQPRTSKSGRICAEIWIK